MPGRTLNRAFAHRMDGGKLSRPTMDIGEIPHARGTLSDVADARQAFTWPLRILIVEGDPAMRESYAAFLEHDGHSATLCRRGDEARDLLERQPFDIVLVDLQVSGVRGIDLIHSLQARSPETFVIATSADARVDVAVAACDTGAWEFLAKPFSALQLQILVARAAQALRASRASDGVRLLGDRDANGHTTVLDASPSIHEVIALARRVAATDASVFITGESGTGKERVAHLIHRQSRRHGRPLVAINCAAIPEALLETEMFGHRKGAFTGAVHDKQGLLEVANGGTFFLDELIQMPLSTQAKLLRVIQDGIVRRLGSDSVNAVVNVRFIAATNQSPQEAIRDGRLREDLYYRLRVFPIHLPPLRERREDIPLLSDHFLRVFWTRHRGGSPPPQLSDEAQRALVDHPWRGNIRELQNVIEHGVVLFEPGMLIQPEDIPFAIHSHDSPAPIRGANSLRFNGNSDQQGFYEARGRVLAEFEHRYLGALIARTSGNLSRAARLAGIQRTTLYRLMEKHGVHRHVTLLGGEQEARADDVTLLE